MTTATRETGLRAPADREQESPAEERHEERRGLGLHPLRAPEGCVAYLVWDRASREALVVDPRLDQLEELLEAARERGLRIRLVIDTHTHADHLSGARRLAARAGAELLAPAGSKLAAPARRIAPGEGFGLGSLRVEALAAPGHTPDSLALLVDGHLFTGDALFLEGVGRTDFPGGSADDLLGTLEAFEALPGETVVHPGHDYQSRGEACLATLRAEHPVLSLRERAARRERVAGKGAVIPDIAHFLSWNLAASEGQDLPPRAVQALVRGRTAALVDVRTPAEFGLARIAGSVNLPLQDLETRLDELPQGRELIVSCRSGIRARTALETLARHGRAAHLMEGGLEGWRKANLPVVEPRPGALSIDRQVQIVVGLSVLAGTALGAFVTPWALIVPAFFGAGLTFAGLSGTCGLAAVLALMPWNRPASGGAGATAAPMCSAGGAPASCSAGGAPAPSCSAGGGAPAGK